MPFSGRLEWGERKSGLGAGACAGAMPWRDPSRGLK